MITCLDVLKDFVEYLMVPMAEVEMIEETAGDKRRASGDETNEEEELKRKFEEREEESLDSLGNTKNPQMYEEELGTAVNVKTEVDKEEEEDSMGNPYPKDKDLSTFK